MNLALQPHVQKLIDERVNAGKYSTAEDVIAAAVLALDQQERFGDYEINELNQLLAEGERSIAQDGTLDGDDAFQQRAQRRADKRK